MHQVPHRLIEGSLIAAHAIESKDVFIYIRGEYLAEYETLQAAVDEARGGRALRRRQRRRPPRRRRLHLRRGDGAARLARGPPRPAAPAAAVPARAGSLQRADAGQQRLHDRDAADRDLDGRRRSSRRPAPRPRPGTAIFSISGNVERPGNYELELGTPMRELIYEHAGGIAGRPQAEGGHPRRLVGAGADARPDRRPARLRLARRAEDVLRRRLADRRRRPLLHGAARRCARRSSTCTSRAASARRAARGRAGWCRSSRRSSAATGSCPTSSCSSRSTAGSSARCCARSASSPSTRSRATSRTWRDEFVAHIRAGPLPVRRPIVDRGDPRAVGAAPPRRRRREAAGGDPRVSAGLGLTAVTGLSLSLHGAPR